MRILLQILALIVVFYYYIPSRKRFKGVCNKDLMVVLNVYTIYIVLHQLLKHEVVH